MTRAALTGAQSSWQENFYDRHLRDGNELEPFARYMFLNPYRAGLIRLDERWPHWWRWGDIRFEFEAAVHEDHSVIAAWLGQPAPKGAADF